MLKKIEKAGNQTKEVTSHFHSFARERTQDQEKKETLQEGNRRGRILVMDDEPLVRQITMKMLSHLGYQVDVAVDGKETIDLYKKSLELNRPYGAVIMDLSIPGGMGGTEAIKKLLEIDPQVKAIVSSGYSNDPVITDFRQYGFQDFLRKPYLLMELKKTLEQVLVDR